MKIGWVADQHLLSKYFILIVSTKKQLLHTDRTACFQHYCCLAKVKHILYTDTFWQPCCYAGVKLGVCFMLNSHLSQNVEVVQLNTDCTLFAS